MKLDNPEYENALLGCILLDNRVLDEYTISGALFNNNLTREVWKHIESAKAMGATADIREIALRMPDKAATVASLTDVPSAANVKFYHSELVELARRRGLFKLARDVSALAHEADSSNDIFTEIDRRLAEISGTKDSGYKPASSYIPNVLSEIEYASKNQGRLSGIDTGFSELNDKTNGWQKQELIIIGARPSRGKTALALNCASAALRSGNKVGFFSVEMSAESIIKRMISDYASVKYSNIRNGFISKSDIASIAEACQKIASQGLYINDTPSIKLADLASDARRMKRNENINILFVDYMSIIDNKRKDIPRHEQVAEIGSTLKGLARELDIPVVSLSQLTRETEGTRPTMANLRDSGALEQDADVIGLLHRVGYTDDTRSEAQIDFLLEKNRSGATGDIHMIFKPSYMRFKEVEN